MQVSDDHRVGLYFNRTGVPLFLLATSKDVGLEPLRITDLSLIPMLISESSELVDRTFVEFVRAFFAAGGSELRVIAVQLQSTDDFAKLMLGEDRGFRQKSGSHAVLQYDGLTDLIAIPQAPIFLGTDELMRFYSSVLCVTGEIEHCILLTDPPRYDSVADLIAWASKFNHPRVTISYPWMLVDHQWFTPPSVVMAALIQKNDRLRSIADSPANQQLCSRISPNKCFSRYDLSLLNQAHINVFIEKANRDVVLWGSYTSSKSHGHETALPVARTIGSIRDAVARTVEPYLMEPRTPKSCSDIEFSLNKLFSKLHQKRIFSQTKEPFQIECFYRNQARFSDASIDIDIRFVIDRAESYLGLNCGY